MDGEEITRKLELVKPADRPVLHVGSEEAEAMLWRFCVGVCKNGGLVVVHGDALSWEPRRPEVSRWEPDVVRVAGRWRCPTCGKHARDHPEDPDFPWPTFVLLCDGRHAKV